MVIATDARINVFEASQESLANTTSAINNAAFSDGINDLNAWTNTDDVDEANFTLKIDWNTTAPDVGTGMNLYARKQNVQSTNDDDIPTANFRHEYIGRFPVKDVLTEQFITKRFFLPNWITQAVYHFYLENQTGENCEAGWDLYVDASTDAPHP